MVLICVLALLKWYKIRRTSAILLIILWRERKNFVFLRKRYYNNILKKIAMERITRMFWFAAIVALCASCSKSLTDIGHKGGSTRLSNVNVYRLLYEGVDVGFSDSSVGRPIDSHAPSRIKDGVYYYDDDNNQYPINQILLAEYSRKESQKFLNKFYASLLDPQFDARKFTKRYKSCCVSEAKYQLREAVANAEPMEGWHMFLPKEGPMPKAVSVTYKSGDWFDVCFDGSTEPTLAIEVVVNNVKKPPYIINVRRYGEDDDAEWQMGLRIP